MRWSGVGVAIALLIAPGTVLAQQSEVDLAKQLANPIASLISVPFQSNYDCCFGPNDASRYLLNIQPVVPITLNPDWNLIMRTILPVISMGSPAPTIPSSTGTGDTVQSFFFSPSQPVNGVTWGVGPVFLWPTGNNVFGSQKWDAGPTVILSGVADVNSTFLQPFLSYTFPDTTTISLNTESTYNWITKEWTVPINLSVAHIFNFGSQPVQFQIGPRFYAVRPSGGPDWGARFNITFLFPKG